jgi:hypothetical protein
VNVHVVGGCGDLVQHLQGATMRPAVILGLISELRRSGYPGYIAELNAEERVAQRMVELYGRYGDGPFIPDKVRQAAEEAHRAKLSGGSLIYDKNATPAEPVSDMSALEASLRPLNLVAHKSSMSSSTVFSQCLALWADMTLKASNGGAAPVKNS